MKKMTVIGLLAAFSGVAFAQMSPLGLWNTIDDKTGKPKAEVRIATNAAGELSAVVVRGLEVNPDPEANCEKCTDDRKGNPKLAWRLFVAVKK